MSDVHPTPRIRCQYRKCSVDSLTKLHRRIKNVDVTLDDRNELSTTRKAWNEVRDNIERGGSVDVSSDVLSLPSPNSTEAQTRQAFLATLTIDVVQPLTTLKVRSLSYLVFECLDIVAGVSRSYP